MERDDIIRLAREAGLFQRVPPTGHVSFIYDLMEFTALVAAAEREACALMCVGTILTITLADRDYNLGCLDCAKAIRARGEK